MRHDHKKVQEIEGSSYYDTDYSGQQYVIIGNVTDIGMRKHVLDKNKSNFKWYTGIGLTIGGEH